MKLLSLEEQYNYHLNQFKKNKINPHPAELLALLLLPNKDNYLSLTGNLSDFYNYYKNEINEKINQVMNDFDLTKEDIIEYTTILEFNEEEQFDYDKNSILHVFANGFRVVQWGVMFHPNWSPERIHNAFSAYWGRKTILDYSIEETKSIKKQTINESKRKIKRKISTATIGFEI